MEGFKSKKAFIVTIIVPDEWLTEDVVEACNVGIKILSTRTVPRLALGAIDYHVTVADKFHLRLPD